MSSDFDPRILWTRREAALVLTGGVVAGGATVAAAGAARGEAERASRGGPRPLLVTDATLAGAQRFAQLLDAEFAPMPERTDPLRFWQARVGPRLASGAVVMGATFWADFLLLRGLGEERRLRVRFQTGAGGRRPENDPALEALADRLEATLGAASGPQRISWILA